MNIFHTIYSRYAEEIAFLWIQRDAAVTEPHYSLVDLTKLDNRVEAHLDGLRIAGEPGIQICKDILTWREAGEVFTAAVLAFESNNEARINEVLEIGGSEYELSRGVISAVGWLHYDQAEKHIKKLLAAESPALKRIGIAASAIHRRNPGQILVDAAKAEDPLLKTRALKAIGELGRNDLVSYLQYNMNSEDEKCRFYAAWSAALFGFKAAIPVLQAIALQNGFYSERAANMALRQMDLATAHNWIKELAQSPDQIRKALIGAGVVGDPALIPWLITFMENNELTRVAGEALTMITGVDIADDDLEGEWPEGFEAGPTENPEDEDVEMDTDEDLPWPEPELISKWWENKKNKFQNGRRYLIGKPITSEWLQQVLREGTQRQRATAAIELAMLNPGKPLFEVRASGFRQQQILGLKITRS